MAYGIGRNIALLVWRINRADFFELGISSSIKYKLMNSAINTKYCFVYMITNLLLCTSLIVNNNILKI